MMLVAAMTVGAGAVGVDAASAQNHNQTELGPNATRGVYLYNYSNQNPAGGVRVFAECDDDLNYADNHFDNGLGLNDRVSSVTNHSPTTITLYSEKNWSSPGTGESAVVKPWSSRTFSGTGWPNNMASSHNWWGC